MIELQALPYYKIGSAFLKKNQLHFDKNYITRYNIKKQINFYTV